MTQVNFSPLQLYMRYYAAEVDVNSSLRSGETLQLCALKSLSAKDLSVLIEYLEFNSSTGDETANRKLFLDGHHYFKWNNPASATILLQDILNNARRVRADTSKTRASR